MTHDDQGIGNTLERIEEKLDLILKKLDKSKSKDNFTESTKLTDEKEIEDLERKLDDAGDY